MRAWIAAGLLVALAGCADNPQSHGYALMSSKLEEMDELTLYREDLDSDAFAPLRGKINFTETYRHGMHLCGFPGAAAYPTPTESIALRRWAAVRAAYFERFHAIELKTASTSEKVAPLAQRYVAALEDDLDHSTALIDDLAAGKMTYCGFAAKQMIATFDSADHVKPLRREMVAAMVDDYYFDGTGLGRHPGKVKAQSYLINSNLSGAPLGDGTRAIPDGAWQAGK